MLPENVILLIGPATVVAQVLVNFVRLAAQNATQPLPSWVSPALAALFGMLAAFLLMLATEISLTPANLATAALAGLFAGFAAVGQTELTRRAT